MNRAGQSPSIADIDLAASDWVVRRNFGLTADEQVELAKWAAVDPRHAEALARHAEAWSMLDHPRSMGKGEFMVRELRVRSRRRRWRLGTATAAMAAACLVAVIWRGERAAVPLPGASAAAGAVVLLPETRILPDGSKVELKPAAAITVDFTATMRRVILQRGEAHFEVTKNPQRPFLVTAAGIDIRAVGTAFGVQLGTTAVEVLVTEGRVSVEKSGGSSRNGRKGTGQREAQSGNSEPGIASAGLDTGADGGQARGDGIGTHSLARSLPYLVPITLDAGNRVVVDIINETALPLTSALSRAELARRLAWRAPRLEFSDTPLAEAVALMNRYSTIRIEIADTALARMRVNGLFRADNTETFVRLLEASFDATAEQAGDVIVLKRVTAPGR